MVRRRSTEPRASATGLQWIKIMGLWLIIGTWSAIAGLPATARPVAPRPPLWGGLSAAPRSTTGDFILNISPATISFQAANPDLMPAVAGSASASVSWQNRNGNSGEWSLTVAADATRFHNCPGIPISAVTVTCASAATNTGRSGNCRPPFALSTSPQVIAGGKQGSSTFNYAVVLNFTLADSWNYIAETSSACSLSLSYTATVP